MGRRAEERARTDRTGKELVVAVAAADAEDVPSSIVASVGMGLLRLDRGGRSTCSCENKPRANLRL